ncbi:HAD family hydrolase, partial [Bacillus sp. JJ722]|uniref:HAD family hydrolase n=1 Tax=Bacillus sp. JJ722 TaxID=3122973 RepID=UPI002FFDDD8E
MKLILIDMDRTLLLNEEIRINESDIEAIKLSQVKGNKVVITTGRAYSDAKHILDNHKLNCLIVASNGAEIGEGNNYKVIEEIPVPLCHFLI